MKTKSFKRVTSLILTFAMLLSLAPASFAVDDPIDVSDDVVVSDVSNVDQAVDNTVDADEPASEGEEVTPDVSSDEATENTSDDVDTPATEEQNTADNGISLVAAANTYYVANSAAGGSDKNGNGTETSPYMTIGKAIEAAANEDEINIVLMSDISATQELKFEDSSKTINFSSNGSSNYKIQYTGSTPIGTESGFIKVTGGAIVNFDHVDLYGSTGTYDGRVIYVADKGTVNLTNTTVTRGRVNNVTTMQGGAGALAADHGVLNIGAGVVISGNTTTAGGGALFVCNGGQINISDDAEITDNTAAYGAGVYADTQTESYGGLHISDDVQITGNKATQQGSGMYICKSANATVKDDVVINNNKTSGAQDNVYLEDEATLDIAGTTTGANIGISADPEEAYRLVSLPDAYTIQPTKTGDEKGWHDDCGTWDIRHMTIRALRVCTFITRPWM